MTKPIHPDNASDRPTEAARLALAREFEKMTATPGVGLSLGVWAGRGDWASMPQTSKGEAGRRALTELDGLIERLAEFRGRLGEVVDRDGLPSTPATAEAETGGAARPVDPDDTSRCPRADRCASCGTPAIEAVEGTVLEVATITVPIGVLCHTLCTSCVDTNRLPKLSWPAATTLVLEHCEHLGCDLEDMAAAIAETLR
jgi:hypothetical protein